jgi:hypothetical protein
MIQRARVRTRFWRIPALQVAAAIAAVSGPVLAWQAYNNSVVTGAWWKLPYRVHDTQYAACPTFLWQPAVEPPTYRHTDMEQYYVGWEQERFLKKRAAFGLNSSAVTKIWIFARFFIGPLLVLPVALAIWRRRVTGVHHALFALAIALLAMTQSLYLHPHYLAPFVGFVYLLAVQGWRLMHGFGKLGPPLVPALCLAAVVGPCIDVIAYPYHRGTRRNDIQARLLQQPGRHLVFVEPGADYDCHECWAYNEADLASARIIWARSIDTISDACLAEHFRGRCVWHLHVDRNRCDLQPEEPATKFSDARP